MTSDFLKLFGLGQAAKIPPVGAGIRPGSAPPQPAAPAVAPQSNSGFLASLFGGSNGDGFEDLISKLAGGMKGIRPGDDFWTAAARGFGGAVSHGDALESARQKAGLASEDRRLKRSNAMFDRFLRGRADDRAERADARAGGAAERAKETHAADLAYKQAQTDWTKRRGTGRTGGVSGGYSTQDIFRLERAVAAKRKELGFGTDQEFMWDEATKAAKQKELDDYRAGLQQRLNEHYERIRGRSGAATPVEPTKPVTPGTSEASEENEEDEGWESLGENIRIRPQP